MSRLRVGINGFGRIGRGVLRAFIEYHTEFTNIEIIAINDIAPPSTLLHLLKYDSTHGRLTTPVTLSSHRLHIEMDTHPLVIDLLCEKEPQNLPWQSLGVDVVLECTGIFRRYDDAYRHITAGAKKVIIGAAPFDRVDDCIVVGVNDKTPINGPVISSVSCTTQALVPLLWLLDDHFGIKSAMLTEIHAVTADQNVLDGTHRDLRRARACGHNIIPTSSSSINATIQVLPKLLGKLAGYSVRVPTIDVALIDVTVTLDTTPSQHTLHQCLEQASKGSLACIMGYTDEPLVSSDFLHDRHSLIIDAQKTIVCAGQIKVIAWYDNEWGYANRLLDLCQRLATQDGGKSSLPH